MRRLFITLAMGLCLCACSKSSTKSSQVPGRAISAARLNVRLGMNYLQQHRNDIAKAKLLKALALSPKLPEANFAMGYYLFKTGNLKQAEQYYQKAYKLAPNDPDVLNSYGVFLCETDRYKKAEKLFIKATKAPLFTAVGLTYQNAGSCAYIHNHLKAASSYFKQALKQDPRLPLPYLRLAQISFNEKQYQRAGHYLNQFNRLADPTIDSLRVAIGLAKANKNKSKAASLQLQLDDRISSLVVPKKK